MPFTSFSGSKINTWAGTPKTPPCRRVIHAKHPGFRCQNYILEEEISAASSLAEKTQPLDVCRKKMGKLAVYSEARVECSEARVECKELKLWFHHDIYLDLDTKSGFKVRILSSILCVQSEPEIFRFTENNNRARLMGGHICHGHTDNIQRVIPRHGTRNRASLFVVFCEPLISSIV